MVFVALRAKQLFLSKSRTVLHKMSTTTVHFHAAKEGWKKEEEKKLHLLSLPTCFQIIVLDYKSKTYGNILSKSVMLVITE